MFTNMGVPKAAIIQKSDYSVGDAWLPVYSGSDDAGQEAASWLTNVWFPLCDIRGGVFNWRKVLSLLSIAIDRDGDAFILLTHNDADFPQIQLVPGHMVHSDQSVTEVQKGGYKGLRIQDGVIYNARNQAVAYRVNHGQGADAWHEDVSARDMIHLFDPIYQESGRGLPAFTHALEDLKHMLQSTEYERVAQLMLSSIALIEHNDLGGPDLDDPAFTISADTTSATGITSEVFDGGTTRYFKANSGGKLETIDHNRPGDLWESFHDRLTRAALAGVGWSYSLVWKNAGQGTAERMEIERARRSITQRQRLMDYAAKRICTYAVAKAATSGRLEMPGNMLAWSFTRPARLTVDDGRESKSLIESWRAGKTNDTEILSYKGQTPEAHYRQRAEEEAMKQLIADEVGAKHGVHIDARQMGMLTPNDQPDITEEDNEQ
jgi:capsid protein